MFSLVTVALLIPPLQCPPDHMVRVFDTGRKIEQCVSATGQRNGPQRQYHPDGSVAIEGSFSGNQQTGTWTHFSDLGRKTMEVTWVKGKRHGAYRTWRDDGSLQSQGQYVDGVRDGLWKYFNADGQLTSTAQMRFDKRNGEVRNLRADGTVESIDRYLKDRRDGRQEDFDESGRLKFFQTYALGKRDGLTETFDATGKLRRRGRYAKGKKHGAWEIWRDGRLWEVERYRAGKRHGLREVYGCEEAPDRRKEEEPWADGERHGTRVRRVCRTGDIASKETFAKGKTVERLSYQKGVLVERLVKHRDRPGPKGAHTSRITYWPDGQVRQTVLSMPKGKREVIRGVERPVSAKKVKANKAKANKKMLLKLLGTRGAASGQVVDTLTGTGNADLEAAFAGTGGVTTTVTICGQQLRADARFLKCTRQPAQVDLKHLSKLSRLEELDLTGTPLRALPPLQGMRLKRVALQGTKITDLRPLAAIESLVYVDLINTPVRDLSPLLKLPKLTDITLMSSKVPAAKVAAFRKARPDVRVLARFSDLKRRPSRRAPSARP
jgi:antitoxin component YwqK of YwqJK toxin-antitoxin module